MEIQPMPQEHLLAIAPEAISTCLLDGGSCKLRVSEQEYCERVLEKSFLNMYVGSPQLGLHAPEISLA